MKQIFSIIAILFAFQMQAQKLIKIDIDSIFDNQTIVQSEKWQKTKDSVRIITWKVNGQVYGDSTNGNVNITIEWRLDTSKAVKIAQNAIDEKRKAERDQKENDLKRFYEKNPDLKPKGNGKLGIIADVPKPYEVIVIKKTPPKRWYQIRRKK